MSYRDHVSVRVSIPELFEQLDRWDFGYLITGSEEGRPHVIALRPTVVDGRLRFDAGGGRACRNATVRPEVTVVFPPYAESNGFSLVVDGDATVEGEVVAVAPTSALLHRPAP
jgi:hypothetical protein